MYSTIWRFAAIVVFSFTTIATLRAGDPVPGLDVSLEQIPGGIIKHGATDMTGTCTFTGLPAGKFKVTYKKVLKSVENHNSS